MRLLTVSLPALPFVFALVEVVCGLDSVGALLVVLVCGLDSVVSGLDPACTVKGVKSLT